MGYWGKVTASMDWCEPNYTNSFYIAEYWNTITNLFYLFSSGLYLYRLRNVIVRWDALQIWPAYLLIVVGLGSMAFHGTLLRNAQWTDELPMLYLATCYLLLGLMIQFRQWGLWFDDHVWTGIAFGFCALVTYVYTLNSGYVLFVGAFSVILWTVIAYDVYLVYFMKKQVNSLEKKYFWGYFLTAALAVFVWTCENIFCPKYPGMDVLKLHCMWHFLTAVSTYRKAWLMNIYYYNAEKEFVIIQAKSHSLFDKLTNLLFPKLMVVPKGDYGF